MIPRVTVTLCSGKCVLVSGKSDGGEHPRPWWKPVQRSGLSGELGLQIWLK